MAEIVDSISLWRTFWLGLVLYKINIKRKIFIKNRTKSMMGRLIKNKSTELSLSKTIHKPPNQRERERERERERNALIFSQPCHMIEFCFLVLQTTNWQTLARPTSMLLGILAMFSFSISPPTILLLLLQQQSNQKQAKRKGILNNPSFGV